MKHPHLPQYFAIKRDENNPLWEEYIEWVISESCDPFWGTFEYVGFDGSELDNGFNAAHEPKCFYNPVTLIPLWQWKQAIDKTEDMKETELQSVPAPDFDPNLPFEVSQDGEHWHTVPHYIGLTSKGKYLVEINDHRAFGTWNHIRNIEPFTAAMLEVGEWMEVEKSEYESCPKGTVVARGRNDVREIKTGKEWSNNEMHFIWGKRVNVNITTEEI